MEKKADYYVFLKRSDDFCSKLCSELSFEQIWKNYLDGISSSIGAGYLTFTLPQILESDLAAFLALLFLCISSPFFSASSKNFFLVISGTLKRIRILTPFLLL